jgi:Ribbon-helix-helix protein, copG family
MEKTTVYLPKELKDRIALVARREGRSEAAVIRAALDEYASNHTPPRPKLPLFRSGAVLPVEDWDEALRGFGED